MTRLAISTEFLVAWGFLLPPIIPVGFLYLAVEAWCYRVARTHIGVGYDDDCPHLPRSQILFGFWVSSILLAVHVSVGVGRPDWATLVTNMTFAVVVVAIAISFHFCYRRWQTRQARHVG